MGGIEANTSMRSSLVAKARTPPPSFQWEKGAEQPMVDRKAQNAVGSCRSAMIFSHEFENRAGTVVGGQPHVRKASVNAEANRTRPTSLDAPDEKLRSKQPTQLGRGTNDSAPLGSTIGGGRADDLYSPRPANICGGGAGEPTPNPKQETSDAGAAFRLRSEGERNG